MVQIVKGAHDALSDFLRRDLLLAQLDDLAFDPVDGLLYLLHGDRPLFASLLDAADDLFAVEGLAAAVLLDDQGQELLDALVGGETLAAGVALAAAADRLAVLGVAAVNDGAVSVGTEGAF